MSRTRVLLADDHEAMLDRVKGLLEKEFQVVGTARDGQAAIEAVTELRPDVLILDISMPVLSGLQAALRLKQMKSTVRIVFLTVHEDPDFARQAIARGALGYVAKPRLATDLSLAIKEVLAGRSFVSPSISPEDDNWMKKLTLLAVAVPMFLAPASHAGEGLAGSGLRDRRGCHVLGDRTDRGLLELGQ